MPVGFVRLVIAVWICALVPIAAGAASIRYAWTGFAEPGDAPGNPWGLSGDGSAVTQDDGTPFSVEVLVDEAAIDQDGSLNPAFAEFIPISATLIIGGTEASLGSVEIRFLDDDPVFAFDDMGIQAQATLLSTTLPFNAAVRLPIDTFALADPAAPDLPPLFAETAPIQFGAFAGDVLTYPADAPVTAELVPEPSTAALLGVGACVLAAARRRGLAQR